MENITCGLGMCHMTDLPTGRNPAANQRMSQSSQYLVTDCEDHRGADPGSGGDQPSPDRCSCVTAAGEPDSGRDTAVDSTGTQLDTTTVSRLDSSPIPCSLED